MRQTSFLLIGLLAALPMAAQMRDNQERKLSCNNGGSYSDNLVSHCEMREQTMPAGALQIDSGGNGGITVKGWSRPDVLVRARIQTAGATDAEARALASQVQFVAGAGQVQASGPSGGHWAVSYEIFTPHRTDFSAKTVNGGLHIQDVEGRMQVQTTNGGVHMERVGGSIKGGTTNGGVHVELAGNQFTGEGMDLHTTNGGIHVDLPPNFNANLEAQTEHGGLHVDFLDNLDRRQKQVSARINGGGATLRLVTQNGGVHVGRLGQ